MYLQMACLCDHAFLSMDGKLNIIGEFNSLFFEKKFEDKPLVAAPFLVTSYLSNNSGEFNQIVRLLYGVGENRGKKVQADAQVQFKINNLKGYVVQRWQFAVPDFGQYVLQILVDDPASKPLMEIPLIIQKYVPPQQKQQ